MLCSNSHFESLAFSVTGTESDKMKLSVFLFAFRNGAAEHAACFYKKHHLGFDGHVRY